MEEFSMAEMCQNFTPVSNNLKMLSPITDFAPYLSNDDGTLVEAIKVPRWGGLRRWVAFIEAEISLDLLPKEIYCASRNNFLSRHRENSSFEAYPGDWIIKDSNGVFKALKESKFEENYKACEPTPTEIDLKAADFSDALMWLKEGKRVARKGWNGNGQFCWMVPEGHYPARMEAIKGHFTSDMVPYGAYFSLKNTQDVVVPWVPSVGDLLATDWYVHDVLVSDIPPHQLRVLEELAQVSDRLKKLNSFIDGRSEIFASLPCAEQSRLREQATYMADYEDVLIRRVIAFS
ncbi:TPA: DUF2829 domain-containing protein [Klebsiella aerogenes]|nr:DUF2829 domain-containing protein [Klebsiella aerogenes]